MPPRQQSKSGRAARRLVLGASPIGGGVNTALAATSTVRRSRREMHPEMVAAYIAKYATKAAEDFGLAPQRLHPLTDLDGLPVTDHTRQPLATAVQIGAAAGPYSTWSKLTRWLHMLGFRGHFATKSRRYSVTLGRLRGERRARRQRQTATHRPDHDDDQDHDDTTLVVTGGWEFIGTGWTTTGDAALAASAAARAREYRELAREHTTHPDHE